MACFIVPMVQAIATTGELTWAFPFFTALTQTGGVKVFFHEILAVGVPMSLALTSVWALWAVLRTKAARA